MLASSLCLPKLPSCTCMMIAVVVSRSSLQCNVIPHYSYIAINGGKLVEGSALEITDCCHYHPCSGRFVENAFKCVHDIGGLCAAAGYHREHECACNNATCTPFGTVNGSRMVPKGMHSLYVHMYASYTHVYVHTCRNKHTHVHTNVLCNIYNIICIFKWNAFKCNKALTNFLQYILPFLCLLTHLF